MAKIIAFANQKGGVSKTTSVMTLGHALTMKKKKILLVDIDPQASLTLYMGNNPDSLDKTIYHVLLNNTRINDVIIQSTERPHLLPSNIELSAAEIELMSAMEREMLLKDILKDVVSLYDYIIIDCPPSLGLLTINALVAAHYVIIPLKTDFLAMKGVTLLLRTITQVQKRPNQKLKVMGILPTIYDKRTTHNREVLEETQKTFQDTYRVFDAIHKSIRFEEVPAGGVSILEYAPETPGAKGYVKLAEEVLNL